MNDLERPLPFTTMQTSTSWWGAPPCSLLLALLGSACGGERLSVGMNPEATNDGSAPTERDAETVPPASLEAGSALSLTLSLPGAEAQPICRGECVLIEAAPSGGNPPYTVTFEGGEEAGALQRRFCPLEDTRVEAEVLDSTDNVEFGGSQQADASVTLQVRDCADAGSTSPSLCLSNPSFEQTLDGPQMNFWSTDWTACNDFNYTVLPNPILADALGATLPPAEGQYHVTLISGLQNDITTVHGAIGQRLCAAMAAGTRQQLSFAAYTVSGRALIPLPEDRARLRIWGSMTECGEEELLWESPYLRDGSDWQRVCASFVPSKAFTYLRLATDSDDLNGRYLHLDDLRALPAGQSCP